MVATSSTTSIGLETTRRRIARWRETRAYRGAAMPAALWAVAGDPRALDAAPAWRRLATG